MVFLGVKAHFTAKSAEMQAGAACRPENQYLEFGNSACYLIAYFDVLLLLNKNDISQIEACHICSARNLRIYGAKWIPLRMQAFLIVRHRAAGALAAHHGVGDNGLHPQRQKQIEG